MQVGKMQSCHHLSFSTLTDVFEIIPTCFYCRNMLNAGCFEASLLQFQTQNASQIYLKNKIFAHRLKGENNIWISDFTVN